MPRWKPGVGIEIDGIVHMVVTVGEKGFRVMCDPLVKGRLRRDEEKLRDVIDCMTCIAWER